MKLKKRTIVLAGIGALAGMAVYACRKFNDEQAKKEADELFYDLAGIDDDSEDGEEPEAETEVSPKRCWLKAKKENAEYFMKLVNYFGSFSELDKYMTGCHRRFFLKNTPSSVLDYKIIWETLQIDIRRVKESEDAPATEKLTVLDLMKVLNPEAYQNDFTNIFTTLAAMDLVDALVPAEDRDRVREMFLPEQMKYFRENDIDFGYIASEEEYKAFKDNLDALGFKGNQEETIENDSTEQEFEPTEPDD